MPEGSTNSGIDALSPLDITDMSMPASPEKLWRAINEASKAQALE